MSFSKLHNPFIASDDGKYAVSLYSNQDGSYQIYPTYLGHDWDEFYDKIDEEFGYDLHKFYNRSEAVKKGQEIFNLLTAK